MNKYLVIDIGGTFTKYAVMDEDCSILRRGKAPTKQGSADIFLGMLEDLYRQEGTGTSGIAVSAAGVIDSKKGFLYNAGSISGIYHLDFAGELEKRTGVPVSLEQDARCAAIAELWKGSLKGCRNAVSIVLGTAVGGAVIIDGNILEGVHQGAGQFSYILTDAMDPDNPWKTLAMKGGAPSLIRICAEKTGVPEEKLTGEIVFEKANQGDAAYLSGIRQFAEILAAQILNLYFILDPERIAIGGGISAQPLLISMIREEMEQIAGIYPHRVPVPEITACRFHNDSNLIGALYVLLEQRGK